MAKTSGTETSAGVKTLDEGGELSPKMREAASSFVERVHERVFKPTINETNRARLEAVRDAMLLRVKLAQTVQDLDGVLQSYTTATARDQPW